MGRLDGKEAIVNGQLEEWRRACQKICGRGAKVAITDILVDEGQKLLMS